MDNQRVTNKLVSVVIPVFNELSRIEDVVAAVRKAPLPSPLEKEIIIVDDGSRDGTPELLDRLRDKVDKVHLCGENSGKGTALRVGFELARGDIIIIQDADLEYFPDQYSILLEPILSGRADVVYGSRFKGSIEGMKFRYWLANKALVWTVRLLYGVWLTDEATAYKVFRREVLNKFELKAKGFEFCPEFTAKVIKAGLKIEEVPIRYRARSVKEGKKIKWSDGVIALWTLIKYRFCE